MIQSHSFFACDPLISTCFVVETWTSSSSEVLKKFQNMVRQYKKASYLKIQFKKLTSTILHFVFDYLIKAFANLISLIKTLMI
jgi:hypothetical protein